MLYTTTHPVFRLVLESCVHVLQKVIIVLVHPEACTGIIVSCIHILIVVKVLGIVSCSNITSTWLWCL